MNELDAKITARALDGYGGGEWEPIEPIELRGNSVLKVDTPVESDDVSTKQYVDTEVGAAETQIQLVREARAYEALLSGTGLENLDYLTINSATVNEGFGTFSIGGGGTELRFPQYSDNALNGIYCVQIEVKMTNDGTDNPTACMIRPTRYDSSGPTETPLRAAWQNFRWSSDPVDLCAIDGSMLFDLTGLTTTLARLRLQKVGTGVSDVTGYIRVFRIGDGGGGAP